MKNVRRDRRFVAVTAVGSLAIAALLAWLVIRDVNSDLRELKLQQVRLAAAAIDPLHLGSLAGTPADLANPAYRQLKLQMQRFRNAGRNYRFAYLLGRHPDGRVFFYVDNEAPDSRDHSPPGQIYKEASPELQRIFTTGEELVEGPLPDAWGTWVTPLVPIRDPAGGTIRAVFGMDIGVEGWHWEIVSRAALPVLLMLFLVLLLDHWLLGARSRALHRESEEQHRIFFTESPDACLTIDAGLVTDCNHAAELLFGTGREGLIGKDQTALSPALQPDGRTTATVVKTLLSRLSPAGSRLPELTLQRTDGTLFPAELSVSAALMGGRPVHFASIRDITFRKLAEAEIKLQLEEKETLLLETHHRIKNNLASIAAILTLQRDSLPDRQAAASLQETISMINSMGALYQKMLLTREYRELSADTHLGSLADSVIRLFGTGTAITLHKELEPVTLDAKKLFYLGIIVNELLTNALKYAFAGRERGSIALTLSRTDERITLTIADDGAGLPAGFDHTTAAGFGLTLVRILCRQLAADFSVSGRDGTTFVVSFGAGP